VDSSFLSTALAFRNVLNELHIFLSTILSLTPPTIIPAIGGIRIIVFFCLWFNGNKIRRGLFHWRSAGFVAGRMRMTVP